MSELDQNKMVQFIKSHPDDDDKRVTERSGISEIIPGSVHEGILFDPCGYSMNGLKEQSYSTIHVTPQPHCSYVSYETNIQLENFDRLVTNVLDTFKPGKFIVTLISNEVSRCSIFNLYTIFSWIEAAASIIFSKFIMRFIIKAACMKGQLLLFWLQLQGR